MADVRVVVVIPAGGTGRRMGAGRPKQYLPLCGKPLLWHTLSRFEESPFVQGIVLVVREEDEAYCRSLFLEEGRFEKIREIVRGGRERWESVREGVLRTEPEDEVVLVHDAVRPFVSRALIRRVVEAAVEYGAAIAGLPVKDTIKWVEEERILRTPDRSRLWSAQTPQGFRRELLLAAYERIAEGVSPTDDAVLVEWLGHPVRIVEGEEQNVKITTPRDLAWAEWYLTREEQMQRRRRMRVGQGFDVHPLEAGCRLVLGGIEIPHRMGLSGHSDADVLIHAVIDALLGAASLGDIGRLFPDTDPQYEGISSLVLLERVRELLEEKEIEILHVDAVIVAQRPKLAPYLDAMTRNIATALRTGEDSISLKATTTERLGFAGREEGIAAQAVALVEG